MLNENKIYEENKKVSQKENMSSNRAYQESIWYMDQSIIKKFVTKHICENPHYTKNLARQLRNQVKCYFCHRGF